MVVGSRAGELVSLPGGACAAAEQSLAERDGRKADGSEATGGIPGGTVRQSLWSRETFAAAGPT